MYTSHASLPKNITFCLNKFIIGFSGRLKRSIRVGRKENGRKTANGQNITHRLIIVIIYMGNQLLKGYTIQGDPISGVGC